MKTKNQYIIGSLFFSLLFFCFFSCADYLDLKPNRSLVVASELKDLQALLDNSSVMNFFTCGVGEASADNYYLTEQDWSAQDDAIRNLYTWEAEIFYDRALNAWLNHYRVVYYSNFILETLNNIERVERNERDWDQIKGSSLFFRAFNFFSLVSTFGKAYDKATAGEDLGIPLRMTSDFNVPSVRSNLEDSYERIIEDLTEAISLLPEKSVHSLRPSKIASYALLSRVYLAMRNYELANKYAEKCLEIGGGLMDFNNIEDSTYPIPPFNSEVLFSTGGSVISASRMKIDTNLFKLYEDNDLRKTIFFAINPDGYSYRYKGSYNGANSFTGLAMDEVYLNKAECLVRLGKYEKGMETLNQLLVKRYRGYNGVFVGIVAKDENQALKVVLDERRKELVFRDIRWIDIKRLNKEIGNEITIQRNLNGEIFQLLPNDNRYALPLPEKVIEMSSMPQNNR